jgi:alkanesulfonate monooxygenase SsuD/methylene tetrahydromethanopterin reductase-like flavin-dependent oxidoreductase (luciferase family)
MGASFGLILPNRAVILGAVTVKDLLDLTEQGEASAVFDTIWVGDSLLAKPRLESVTLLSALTAITSRVRLGVGCMATFAHRHPVLLAQQWASLDVLSNGRAWLVVCLGGPNDAGAAQALEHAAMGIQARDRIGRLGEGIMILRKLFHEQQVSHQGRFYQFDGVTLQPSPVQNPCPIWIASNPTGLTWKGGASASDAVIERSFRRVARYADGWMTNKVTPAQFRQQ